jgi:hypothetical protein
MKFHEEVMPFKGTDVLIFNPIASKILKLLRLKFLRRALLNCGFVLFMFHGDHDTNKFTVANLVKLRLLDLNQVEVSSLKLSSIKLGSSTSNKRLI